MNVTKATVHEHFKNAIKTSSLGRARFFKKIIDDMYKESW